MWQEEEGQEDIPESFIRCALHQAKIIRERWKFWSGTVPADVSIHLYRLESLLSMNKKLENNSELILPISEPLIEEIQTFPLIEKYLIEPKHNIILQGPDIQRIVNEDKRRMHFWCCH